MDKRARISPNPRLKRIFKLEIVYWGSNEILEARNAEKGAL